MKPNRNIILRWLFNFAYEFVNFCVWLGKERPMAGALIYFLFLLGIGLYIFAFKMEAIQFIPRDHGPYPHPHRPAQALTCPSCICTGACRCRQQGTAPFPR